MKHLFFIGLAILLTISCTDSKERITNRNDYRLFLMNEEPIAVQTSLDSEIIFWENKLQITPSGYIFQQKLGASLARKFEVTGNIEYLHHSNRVLQQAAERTKGKSKAGTLLSLSSNAIKLHQFKAALDYALEAENNTEEIYGPRMMQFDAFMEIGEYSKAIKTLRSTGRMDDFDFKVRYAKYQDHIGQLDSAIYYMESALTKVKNSNPAKWLWAKASLGDYYGHNGQVKKSYQTFLEVLNHDPNYRHALQGIAWIAYSHDRDAIAAVEIYEFLQTRSLMPDQNLNLAEMHTFLGNSSMAQSYENEFLVKAQAPIYKGMYNAYLIDYLINQDLEQAFALARREVANRPTPQSYMSLAWCQYHDRQFDIALSTINEFVIDKTFEPAVLHKASIVAAAAGSNRIARKLLKEVAEAGYELGPLVEKQIQGAL